MISFPSHLFPRWAGGLLLLMASCLVVRAQTEPALDADEIKAKEVLVRWINAIGGVAEVNGLNTGYIQSRIDYGNGGPPVDLLTRAGPGSYRLEYKTAAFGTLVQAFDGKVAWQYNETLGFGFLSEQENRSNSSVTDFRAPIRVGTWFPYRRVVPEETIDGKKLLPVRLVTATGYVEKWYFDPATGYRVRIEVPGAVQPQIVEFSDFRPVFGAKVKEPFHIVRTERGQRMTIDLQMVLYNEPMEPLLFSPPIGPAEDNRRLELLLARSRGYMGAGFLREIQTRVTEQITTVVTSGLETTSKVYQKRPNLMVVEQDSPGAGHSWRGYDGKVGWVWNELEGYREMKGAELQQMLGGADLDGPMKLSAQCPLRKFLDDKIVDGRTLIGVTMGTLRGPEGNFYFDRNTGELVQVETFVQTGADGQLKVTADFADYRRVNGVLLAHTTTVTNPAMQMVTRIKSVRHNVPLDDALFEPRRN